jgi:hypothetical protein
MRTFHLDALPSSLAFDHQQILTDSMAFRQHKAR